MSLEDEIRDPITKQLLVDIELQRAIQRGPQGPMFLPDVLYLGKKQHTQLLQFFSNAALTRTGQDMKYTHVSQWRGMPVLQVDAEDHLGISWKLSPGMQSLLMDLAAMQAGGPPSDGTVN